MLRTFTTTLALVAIALAAVTSGNATPAKARTVHIYGDSIASGIGFGVYDYPSTLESIPQAATALARANGSDLRFSANRGQDATLICQGVASGLIKPDDDVIYEDAGPHTDEAQSYANFMTYAAWCATHGNIGVAPRSPRHLIYATMFDYGNPYDGDAAYDAPFKKYGAPRTPNDVTRNVARSRGARLLDWNATMDAAHAVLEPQGVHVVQSDGIHPTPFGYALLAVSVLRAEGVRITNLTPVVDELMRQETKIVANGYAPTYTRAQAQAWVDVLANTEGTR